MTIARIDGNIDEDVTRKFGHYFRKHFGTVLIKNSKFGTEVFVRIYVNHPQWRLHSMRSLYLDNITELLWYGQNPSFYTLT